MRPPLPRDTLHAIDRIVCGPLDVWATELRDVLASVGDARDAPAIDRIAACANAAALIEHLRGEPAAAAELCALQLTWIARLPARVDGAATRALALQPWINLGRLRARAGQREAALRHFALADALAQRQAIELGPCAIVSQDWDSFLARAPDLAERLVDVRVFETLQALLASGDRERLEGFVAARPAPPRLAPIVLEARIRAALADSDAARSYLSNQTCDDAREQAAALAVAGCERHHGHARAVFALYLTHALLRDDAVADARGAVALALAALDLERRGVTSLEQLRVLAPLLPLCVAAGLEALARPLAQAAERCADAHEDQPLRCALLELRLRLEPEDDALRVERRTLARRSLYPRLRAGEGPAPAQLRAPVDALRQQLTAILRA